MDESVGAVSTSTGAASSPAPVSNDTGASSSAAASSSATSTNTSSSTSYERPTDTAPSPAPPVSSDSKVLASGKADNGSEGFILVEDASGKRTLRPAPKGQATETIGETMPDTQPDMPFAQAGITSDVASVTERQNAIPEPYNLDEFSAALANGNIDERRVPQEYQQQYTNFKIGQAIQAYNQNVRAQQQAQAQQIQKQLTPEQKQQQMQEFLTNLDKEAERRAAQSANMTAEDLENLEYMEETDEKLINYKLAKEWHRQELMQGLQQRAAQENVTRARQAAVYRDITAFVDKARADEPNFDAIDKILPERYKTLPYAEGRKIETVINALRNGTISPQQSEELRNYYEATRKEYYAKKNGLTTMPRAAAKPPIVETAGDGRSSGSKYSPDYGALKNANVRGRRAWLADFIRNRS